MKACCKADLSIERPSCAFVIVTNASVSVYTNIFIGGVGCNPVNAVSSDTFSRCFDIALFNVLSTWVNISGYSPGRSFNSDSSARDVRTSSLPSCSTVTVGFLNARLIRPDGGHGGFFYINDKYRVFCTFTGVLTVYQWKGLTGDLLSVPLGFWTVLGYVAFLFAPEREIFAHKSFTFPFV